MKHLVIVLFIFGIISANDKSWFNESKFGIFIHFGLYSQIGYHEWAMDHFRITPEKYEPFANTFNPINFDSDSWAEIIKSSGAKYAVLTSKHHDGFCLFHTDFTDYNIQMTPFNRNIVKEFGSSLKEQNLKFGIYYSVMDWHHPDYLPRRDFDQRPIENYNIDNYRTYMKNQISELLRYNPDLFWFDGDWENTLDSISSYKIREMIIDSNQNILLNNRLSSYVNDLADYITPENAPPRDKIVKDGKHQNFELCHTIHHCWGYDPNSKEFLTVKDILILLSDAASNGGNLLLNIAPKPDGSIDQNFVIRLKEVGNWLAKNGSSIYGTTAGILPKGLFYGSDTIKEDSLFINLYGMPVDNKLFISSFSTKIKGVFINNESLNFTQNDFFTKIDLPKYKYDDLLSLKIVFDGTPKIRNIYPKYSGDFYLDGGNFIIKENTAKNPKQFFYYDKTVIYDICDSLQNLESTFNLKENGNYKIEIFGVQRYELKGDITLNLTINDNSFPIILPERERWLNDNRACKLPFYTGVFHLNKGLNNISLKNISDKLYSNFTFYGIKLSKL